MDESTEARTEKGISLARGPALILGTVLLAAGLYFLYKQHFFPKLANFPNGRAPVQGKVFLGIFGANGWTGMLTAVGGGLLLFGAAQHLLAKTMSLIVGVALGAAAIIALASGNVLGLAAANHWTEIGWGVVAAILLFNTVIPRRRRTVETNVVAADPVERGAAERGAGESDPEENDPVRSDPVERDAVERHAVESDAVERDAVDGRSSDGSVTARAHEGDPAPARTEPAVASRGADE